MKSQNLNKLVHTLHTLGIVRCTEIWTLAHIFDSNFKSTAGSFSSRLDNRTRQYSVLMKKTTGAWTWSGNRPMKFWHKSTYYSIIMAVAMETWKRNGKKLHWGGKKKKKKKDAYRTSTLWLSSWEFAVKFVTVIMDQNIPAIYSWKRPSLS